MDSLFIAATGQDAGKTTVSIGLLTVLRMRGIHAGFIKPVGQMTLTVDGVEVDKDAVLMHRHFLAGETARQLEDMSPISVPRGFTEKYIYNRDPEGLLRRIRTAYDELSKQRDLMVVEGTGHAGVGSVFDASNADVARLLGSKVIIVSEGGIGRCIDQINLNMALFQAKGVEVIGAIVNKVLPAKFRRIARVVRNGLTNIGVPCLGVIPYQTDLATWTVRQLADYLKAPVCWGQGSVDNRVGNTIVAAMEPQNMLRHLRDGALVITPGDRIDNLLVALGVHHAKSGRRRVRIAGIVLTGGLQPDTTVMELFEDDDIPVLCSELNTYDVASRVHNLRVKIGVGDDEKVRMAGRAIFMHVDMNAILRHFAVTGWRSEPAPGAQ